MRLAKRPAADERAVTQLAGDRMDHRHLKGLRRCERRQQSRQACRQHRFAGAGGTDHQQVVAAGRGDLDRPLGRLLALDVSEVGMPRPVDLQLRCRRRQHLVAFEVIDEGEQRRRRQHRDGAGPGGLAALRLGADQSLAAAARMHRRRQHAGYRRHLAVEAEFAQRDIAGDRVLGDDPHRCQQAERDRQVEMAAFLQQIGGGEVDGDPLRRQAEPHRRQGCAHPLAALGDGLVGQADDGEGRHPVRHLHLDGDVEDVDALEGDGADARDHRRGLLGGGLQAARVRPPGVRTAPGAVAGAVAEAAAVAARWPASA
jgi:hypothetical protein